MELLAPLALILAGLLALAGGGEALVRGATRLARLAGVTPAVIGLTVVAMGTSLPELVVSAMSAIRGTPDIAVGNVVGSNIFNVTLILGLTALVLPLPVHGSAVRLEWPFMFGVSILVVLLAGDGELSRLEGAALVTLLVTFTWYMVRLARLEVRGQEALDFEAEAEQRSGRQLGRRMTVPASYTLAGVLLLVLGGRLLVDGSVALARLAGLSERIIGLTIVAAGTSAPEVATSIAAALRRHTDVAVANIIGSNIFNLLAILGLTSLLLPIPVAREFLRVDMVWMLGTSLLLLPVMLTGRRVRRRDGALLLAAYGLYMAVLIG